MKVYVFVAIFLLTFASIVTQPREKPIALQQEFKLKIGESAKSRPEGLEVEFHSVAEDSRCPRGVTCMWAGNAKILLKVKKDAAKPADVELNTNANPKTSRYLEYELRLRELKPYPESDATIKSSDYEVTLTVHKL
jgi:hypothetical protein